MTISQYRSVVLGVLLVAAGCTKHKDDAPAGPAVNGSSIAYVLNDNFTFSQFHQDLVQAGLIDTLSGTRLFTALAPNNDAYLLTGGDPLARLYTGQDLWTATAYHILVDSIVFGPMPLVQNKPLITVAGQPVFFSRYEEAGDTITTVNGVRPVSMDNPATNGPIQVMSQLLNPLVYPNLDGRMRDDTLLTLFCALLQRAGMDSLLAGNDVYTVLAPDNNSLRSTAGQPGSLDLSSLDRIAAADRDTVRNLLMYCVMKDRWFLGDFYHSEYTQPAGVTMLNGETIGITGSPDVYHSIRFTGASGSPAALHEYVVQRYNYADIPVGNGVLHILNHVLIP